MMETVRKGEELNKDSLSKYLEEQGLIKNQSESIEVFQFVNGFSNLTYLLRIGDKEIVLRKPPLGAIKRGHDMHREFKVLSCLHPKFQKAPQVFAYEDNSEIIGSPFYLMEKVEGVILNYNEAVKREVTKSEFTIIAESWLDAFVGLHTLDYKEIGLSDLGKPEGYVERQVSNWSKQYRKASTMDLPDALFVMEWLQSNQPRDYAHRLIHNDFKYDNVVFKEDDWHSVKAILDWEMCTLGDPLMDLGTSLAYWTMSTDGPAIIQTLRSPTSLPGNPSRSDIVQTYAQKSGNTINHLCFYYVFGLFKIAVIVQQIFYRYDRGLTSNKKFAELDKVCAFLCTMAKQAIQKNRIENLF